MENDIDIWEMAKIFGKWLRYMGHGFSISEAALLCWKWLMLGLHDEQLVEQLGCPVGLIKLPKV